MKTKCGEEILLDWVDRDRLQHMTWSRKAGGPVRTWKKKKSYYLHHFILPQKPGLVVVHLNGNKLDNRRANLAYRTLLECQRNSTKANNKHGFRGVTRVKSGAYVARIKVSGKHIHLGTGATPEEAYQIYLHGRKRFFK